MGKDKQGQTKSECSTCGQSKTCSVCGGTGHWATNKNVECSHCFGTGACPVNN